MAAHSNRSPSPLSSRPSVNPNPRNSENNSANRRSFSGNNPFSKPSALTNPRRFDPITPANSPSDFARRRSVGEEKENDEKDHVLKASKLQSPVKGCKNFMSPTISAASKFTPSPRKKVLVERNDPVRTSISLSDGKAMFFSTMSSNVSEDSDAQSEMENQKTENFLDLKVADSDKKNLVSKPSKRVSFSDVPTDSQHPSESLSESVITDSDTLKSESLATDSDSLKFESSLKEKVDSSSIAPLDADPSLPPYDPKTNYLSPRPQFLHYKPNPRIEILLNKEKGLDPEEFKRLEDNLMEEIMSENFSDSEGTEESQTENSQNEETEVTPSADMVIGVDEMEADSHVSEPSEPLPISTSVNNAIAEEDFVQKNGKKPRALFRLMCFSTLVMLSIACVSISVTRSPSLDEFVLKDLSLSDLSNFYHQSRAAAAASARVNFDWFATRVNQLRISSLSFVSKLANELGNRGEQTPLQFMNLSELQRNAWNEESVEELDEGGLEEDLDAELDTFEEEAYEEIDSDDEFEEIDSHEKGFDTQEKVSITEETSPDSVKLDELESEYSQDIQSQREVIPTINTKQRDEQNSIDQSVAVPMDQETELEAPVEVASAPESSACTETIVSDHKSQSDVNTLSESIQSSSEDNSFARIAMGVSSLLAALLAVAAFIYNKYNRNPNSANVLRTNPLEFTGTTKHMEFSQNWETEVDVIGGESCPSEVSSSFQKSASYRKKGGAAANEVESLERKRRKFNKRESLASSSEFSTGSPSYGSFTTYERIPIKHANGDEEIITPVRRSSRIRNHHHQVSSP